MNRLVYLNDHFVHEEKATISCLDLGFQRGYAIFDFFRLIGNQPLHLEDHLDRFYFSASEMRLPVPKSRDELKQVIMELIWENEIPNSGIRIQLSGGFFTDGNAFTNPSLIISQVEFPLATQSMKENGIKLVSYEHQRQLPQVKSTDYIMSIWLQEYLKEQQADDLLYYSNGAITESPRSNFFIVSNEDRVVTPADQILKGITRKKVIELASSQFTIEERRVTKEEAYSAREAFITSTTKQIIPVVQVDGKTIGDGLPGSVTKKLMQQLNEACGFSI